MSTVELETMRCELDGPLARLRLDRPEVLNAFDDAMHDGFHTTGSPQTKASAAYHDHTATGKLKALITPTTPSGCHCSIIRCCGRSEAMVKP